MPDAADERELGTERPEWSLLVRALWRGGIAPGLDALLTPAVIADDEALAEVLAADVEERRRWGVALDIDAYFRAAPDIERRPRARRVLIMAALTQAGDDAAARQRAADELERRFPALADDVRAMTGLAAGLASGLAELFGISHGPGDRLGKYELVEPLGHGAFAQTWRATDTVLHRDVALKLLTRTHLQGELGAARFLAEARAAASIEHASVVRVHEAGRFVETGEFYLDMQLVADGGGRPRTLESLLGAPLDPRAAAGLIAAAARGLSAAHARGVTHRDIKPANVLLAGDGRPLLADFGLAEFRGDDHSGQGGRIAGTPAYIPPEVARGEGATPLSDVYSLGATLRALLSGSEPRADSGSGADALRAARGTPLKPVREDAPDVPRTLGAIVDRATAMEPANRYASADGFAEDLEAWLGYRPTAAGRPGALGIGALWMRRHRGVAAAITAATAIIIGSTAVFVIRVSEERRRALAAEHEAVLQRDAAIAARDIIQAQNVFVARSLNSAQGQAVGPGGVDFTVRQAIALAARRSRTAFPDQPLVEAAVCHFLGQASTGAGSFEQAETCLDRALTLRRTHLGEAHPDTIATMRVLSDLYSVQRRLNEADALRERVYVLLEGTPAFDRGDGLWVQLSRANRRVREGHAAEMLPELERIAAKYRVLPYAGGMDQQEALNSVVTVATRLRQFNAAEAAQREIIQLNTTRLGVDDISTLNAVQALGWVFVNSGRPDEAVGVYRDVLERYVRTVGPKHRGALHVAIELAHLELPKDPAHALVRAREVEHLTADLSPTSQYRQRALVVLGKALATNGDPGAEASLRTTLDLLVKQRGGRHPYTREAGGALIRLLDAGGRPEDAAAVRARLAADTKLAEPADEGSAEKSAAPPDRTGPKPR